ncbi:hypothetical protein AUW17_05305 [Tenacibaculum dicentrarchi]|nr:hypothetical protein AUW17_05305 [Tenacibaculum dicentrarchi]
MEIPKEVKHLLGTKQELGGGLFSGKKELPYEEYNVLDWRFGSGLIMNKKTGEMLHPTFQLLVKKEGMRASRWTRGFPCRSINLENED